MFDFQSTVMLPIVVLGMGLAVLLGIGLFVRNYIKVPPEQAAIFYGRKFKLRDPETGELRERGFRIIKGGATFKWPMVEKVMWLDLNVMTIPITVQDIYSKEGVPVDVHAIANVKLAGDDASLEIAAEQFGGKTEAEIRSTVEETLQGHLRSIVGVLTVEELYQERQKFSQHVQDASAQDLADMGVRIINFPIKDVRDKHEYLDSLGKKRTAEVKRDAAIGEADAQKEEMENTSQAIRLGKEAELANQERIAEAERNLNIKKAIFDAEVAAERARAEQAGPLAQAEAGKDVKRAQIEVETTERQARIRLQEQEALRREKELNATLIKEAEAKKQEMVILAEGEQDAAEKQARAKITLADASKAEVQKQGEGEAAAIQAKMEAEAEGKKAGLLAEAEGKKATLLAEADGERARLLAEAEGKEKLALALAKLDETGKLLQILDAAPEVAHALGEAAAKALGPDGMANVFGQIAAPMGSVDDIRIYDFGSSASNSGNSPISKLANIGPEVVFNFIAKAQALGLGGLLNRFGLSSDILETLAEAAKGVKESEQSPTSESQAPASQTSSKTQ
ncbi:SPFH domain-containing protein [Acidobacteria bacterium AH-259-O06]|nr:SPFH domain-containing protein [Acidobacteria bacterium AH-259-O06]